jgi:hypothetical protein
MGAYECKPLSPASSRDRVSRNAASPNDTPHVMPDMPLTIKRIVDHERADKTAAVAKPQISCRYPPSILTQCKSLPLTVQQLADTLLVREKGGLKYPVPERPRAMPISVSAN